MNKSKTCYTVNGSRLDKLSSKLRTDEKKSPRVSVIMPTYGQEHIIAQSIQSVLDQEYTDYELIVIDDESPDSTGDVVAQYSDPVRYIRQKNQGLPGARNTGIRAARGEIIALLDGDDLYEPKYLSTMVRLLDEHEEADAVYCRSRFVDMTNESLPQLTGRAVPPTELFRTLLRGNFITPNCMVAYKYCYEQVGLFDMAIQKGEWDMWLHFAQRYLVLGTDQILGRYRVVPQSMSSANPKPMLQAQIDVLLKHFGQETQDVSCWDDLYQEAYWRAHILTVTEYLQAHKVDEAYELLHTTLNKYPKLANDLGVFYELSVGDQPRGFRGHFPTWDGEYNCQILLQILDRLFSDSTTTPILKKYKSAAYANANLALGLLSYGSQELTNAREFLYQAIRYEPKFLTKSAVYKTLLQSLLGTRLKSMLRYRQHMAVSRL